MSWPPRILSVNSNEELCEPDWRSRISIPPLSELNDAYGEIKMMAIERILVPIDFSESSLKSNDAVEFSRPYEAELILLFVVERGFYESPLLVPDSGALLKHQARATEENRGDVQGLGQARRQVPDARRVRCRLPGDHRGREQSPRKFDRHFIARTHWLGARSDRQRRGEGRATCSLSGAGDPYLAEAQAADRHAKTLADRAKAIAFLTGQAKGIDNEPRNAAGGRWSRT